MTGLTRKQVADTVGVTIEAVRFYEREGLIEEPPRTEANYRQYPENTINRIRFIKRAQSLGFSLPEVRELLSLRMSTATTPVEIRQRTLEKIADIEEKINNLQTMKRILEEMTNTCPGTGPLTDCPILASLDAISESASSKKKR